MNNKLVRRTVYVVYCLVGIVGLAILLINGENWSGNASSIWMTITKVYVFALYLIMIIDSYMNKRYKILVVISVCMATFLFMAGVLFTA